MVTYPFQSFAVGIFAAQYIQMLADLHYRMTASITVEADHLDHRVLQMAQLLNCEAITVNACVSIDTDDHRNRMPNVEARWNSIFRGFVEFHQYSIVITGRPIHVVFEQNAYKKLMIKKWI